MSIKALIVYKLPATPIRKDQNQVHLNILSNTYHQYINDINTH